MKSERTGAAPATNVSSDSFSAKSSDLGVREAGPHGSISDSFPGEQEHRAEQQKPRVPPRNDHRKSENKAVWVKSSAFSNNSRLCAK